MKLFHFISLLSVSHVSALAARSKTPAHYNPLDGFDIVEDHYIVLFHDGHSLTTHFEAIGLDLSQVSSPFFPIPAINGYRAMLDNHTVHELVRYDPGVRSVLPDYYGEHHGEVAESSEMVTEKRGFWRRWNTIVYSNSYWYNIMLAAGKKLDGPIEDGGERNIMSKAGKGTDIYIMDTGVRLEHRDFGGRARNFRDQVITSYTEPSENAADITYDPKKPGHGTHVAGCAAGVGFGTAPGANIVNVKVVGKSGKPKIGGVVQALSDIMEDHTEKRKDPKFPGSVINMSIEVRDPEDILPRLLKRVSEAGIAMTTSAGNEGQTRSGALCRSGYVVCVGATGHKSYRKASFSNYDGYINIWAPGHNIMSSSNVDNESRLFKSGTSQASPLVAGILATFISHEKIQFSVPTVKDRMTRNALPGAVEGPIADGTNLFAQNGNSNPAKDPSVPYLGAPVQGWWRGGGLKLTRQEAEDPNDPGVLEAVAEPLRADALSTPVNIIASPEDQPGVFGLDNFDDVATPTFEPITPPTATPSNPNDPNVPRRCEGANTESAACIGATIPPSTPYSGIARPICSYHYTPADRPRINKEKAKSGATDFCNDLISASTALIPGQFNPNPHVITGAAENDAVTTLTVLYDVNACPTDRYISTINFAKMGLEWCISNMHTLISTACEQDSRVTNYNQDFTLQGGVLRADCAIWSISAQ